MRSSVRAAVKEIAWLGSPLTLSPCCAVDVGVRSRSIRSDPGRRSEQRNRSLLVEQTCDLIDTVGEEAVLAVGNALAGQIRRLRRRLTGV